MIKIIRRFFLISIFAISCVFSDAQTLNDTIPKEDISEVSSLDRIADMFTFEKPRATISIYPTCTYEELSGVAIGIMPVIQFKSRDTTLLSDQKRPTALIPRLSYSTKGQLDLDFTFVMFTQNGWNVSSFLWYSDYQTAFYGIGNNATDGAFSPYKMKNLVFNGELAKQLSNESFLGLRYDLNVAKISDTYGDVLNPSINGYDGGVTFGLGPIYKYDSRNNVFFPEKGSYHQAYAVFYPKLFGNENSFAQATVDLRKYCSIGNSNNVLAFQGYASFTFGEAPFYQLPMIANKILMRGINHPHMFIDDHAWLARAEYRKYLWWRVSGTLFTELGNNFGAEGNHMFENVKYSYGAGFRFQLVPDKKIHFRADLGFGPKGESALYFTVLEAF